MGTIRDMKGERGTRDKKGGHEGEYYQTASYSCT